MQTVEQTQYRQFRCRLLSKHKQAVPIPTIDENTVQAVPIPTIDQNTVQAVPIPTIDQNTVQAVPIPTIDQNTVLLLLLLKEVGNARLGESD